MLHVLTEMYYAAAVNRRYVVKLKLRKSENSCAEVIRMACNSTHSSCQAYTIVVDVKLLQHVWQLE